MRTLPTTNRLTEKETERHRTGAGWRRRRRTGVLLVTVFVILLLAACARPDKSALPGEPAVRTPQRPAPDFVISLYQGEDALGQPELQFSELLARGKPVVLNMWAGLCPPCRAEMLDFQAIYAEYGDQVLLIGLDVGPFTALGSREDGQALLKELGITYPAGTTFDAGVVRDYRLVAMPTTFFVQPNGEIQNKHSGLLTRDGLAGTVRQLLQASEDR